MKLKLRAVFACVVICLGLMGCNKQQPDAESIAKTAFQTHLQLLQRNTTNQIFVPFSYDIRKTDSLVSPFIGQIEWVDAMEGGPSGGRLGHRLTLVYQEDKWVMKMSESKVIVAFSDGRERMGEWEDNGSVKGIYAHQLGLSSK